MKSTEISIIIRTKNEQDSIRKCLTGVFSQKISKQFEVIIVDSGSTDATLKIISEFNVNLIKIKPEDFTYPYALNAGVRHSSGIYCVFISGDAYPLDESWLEKIINPFDASNVAAVSGRQIPVPGLNPIEEVVLLKAFPVNREHRVLSAANCAIRKDLLVNYPFVEKLGDLEVGNRPTIEDGLWRMNIESKGYKVIYEPDAAVFHSHRFIRFIKKEYSCYFYTGYSLAYFTGVFYSDLPQKNSLVKRTPKTIKYIWNSLLYLIKHEYFIFVPVYIFFMAGSFIWVFLGFCSGLRDKKRT